MADTPKLTPTLAELCRMPKADYDRAIDAMTLGEMLALAGLELEIECDGATPEFNAEVSRLAAAFVDEKHKQ